MGSEDEYSRLEAPKQVVANCRFLQNWHWYRYLLAIYGPVMMSKIYGTCQFCDEKQFCSNVISQKRNLCRNFVLEHRLTWGLKPLKSYKSDRWYLPIDKKNYLKFWNALCRKLQYLLFFWESLILDLTRLPEIHPLRASPCQGPSSTWALPSAFLIARAKM